MASITHGAAHTERGDRLMPATEDERKNILSKATTEELLAHAKSTKDLNKEKEERVKWLRNHLDEKIMARQTSKQGQQFYETNAMLHKIDAMDARLKNQVHVGDHQKANMALFATMEGSAASRIFREQSKNRAEFAAQLDAGFKDVSAYKPLSKQV